MIRWLFLAICLVAGLHSRAASTTSLHINRTAQRAHFPDPLAARPLNPAFDLFPDSSLVDFSYLLDSPAGKLGFVQARDGHFHYEKSGERARFWGVTITQEHIDIPKERIDTVVDNLARAGCNMVRFHSLDNRAAFQYGFIRRTIIDDAPPNDKDTQHFDKEYLDRVHYWVAKLKERGIYSFLVLRAFRHYRDGDEVENAENVPRGATPMAYFNRQLIELQKKYARDLLFENVNPYTKLTLGRDPSVALIEVFNEDSLFARPQLWTKMVQPYRDEIRGLWIDYLKRTHGTTQKLHNAWTDMNGRCALQTTETLEAGSIEMPDMTANQTFEAAQNRPWTNPLKAPQRTRDGVRFALEVQSRYFKEMQNALKEMGVRVPTIGVVAGISVPDTWSAAQEFDFTGENMYQEHPEYEPERPWLPPPYFKNENYMKVPASEGSMPFITRYRWSGKPVAVREWATCWPNPYRAASMYEMAAYSRFQDLDCVLYFGYYTTGDFTRLGMFDLNNDPVRWGLFGPAAHVFLSKVGVGPARKTVQIGYSAEDLFSYSSWINELNAISWIHRLENVFTGDEAEPRGDILITSGRTQPAVAESSNTISFTNARYTTSEQKSVTTAPQESFASVARQVLEKDELFSPSSKQATELHGVLKSDTGELVRNTISGTMSVDTPSVQVLQGTFTTGTAVRTESGKLEVVSQSPFAVVSAIALDNQSLENSQRIHVKMVTVAENRKQLLDPAKHPAMKGMQVMTTEGTTPIITHGRTLPDRATRISLNGKPLVDAYLENGTWELVLDRESRRAYLACDTVNANFEVHPLNGSNVQMQAYFLETPPDPPVASTSRFTYPGWAKYVELRY